MSNILEALKKAELSQWENTGEVFVNDVLRRMPGFLSEESRNWPCINHVKNHRDLYRDLSDHDPSGFALRMLLVGFIVGREETLRELELQRDYPILCEAVPKTK